MDETTKQKSNKNGAVYRLFRNQRFLMVFSLFLAVWVWLILVMVNGEDQERTIRHIPVKFDLSGTLSEKMDLQPFAEGLDELTVDIVIRGKKYEISPAVVGAEDFAADLLGGAVNSVGEHQLDIRVDTIDANDRNKFEIVSVSQSMISVYFDHLKEMDFVLEPLVVGKVQVAEDYYADKMSLSSNVVRISGPATEVNSISRVMAEVEVDAPLEKTTEFAEVTITPVNEYGDNMFYHLTYENTLKATIPVWKKTFLHAGITFSNTPKAYVGAPLAVTMTPATLNAALPEGNIPKNGDDYVVGTIDFSKLSPNNSLFTFPSDQLREIHIFDNTTSFQAQVNMAGMAQTALTLNGSAIQAVYASDTPQKQTAFGTVHNVQVVGPKDTIVALTSQDLTADCMITNETPVGSSKQAVTIRIAREDCWVFGEYATATMVK
ncbi:MAG: hypothetical protein LBB67_05940 [Oscillospiraceae bacterium]|jgi:hypothetical protein|nr:hypothetical protein [Oscillospiraceae bacterium]